VLLRIGSHDVGNSRLPVVAVSELFHVKAHERSALTPALTSRVPISSAVKLGKLGCRARPACNEMCGAARAGQGGTVRRVPDA